ncbi:MAG: acylneuraminate cytidylyltransferase family protein, partial [Treponema sp.]|nr:acylneuraminate cytidylyltransferase family protein [Treponema sp.]
LIQYSIEVARKLASDEDICVSTDDEEIIRVTESLGLKVPFVRPAEYATDTATSNDVILHALRFYEERGVLYDIVVLLQPTSPLRTVEHVKEAMSLYTSDIDMVVSVKHSSAAYVMCKENKVGFLEPVVNSGIVRRQDMPEFYEYNGAVYVINVKALIEKGMSGFNKERKYVMDEKFSWDIDTLLDWSIVENLLVNADK